MAKKIYISGASFIVQDTINNVVDINEPSKDIYFDNSMLNRGFISITQKDGSRSVDSSIGAKILISDAQDESGNEFTLDSFREFMNSEVVFTGDTVYNKISKSNSTATLLDSNEEFIGKWENVVAWTSVSIAVLGSMETDGTLFFDLSTNGGETFVPLATPVANTNFNLPKILNIVESHVRIRYVNGTTEQTGSFSIQTKYSKGQQIALLETVDGLVNGETPTTVIKSVGVGQEPNNSYSNSKSTGVDPSNSTIVALGSNEVFTGEWISTQGFHGVIVQASGTVDGQGGVLNLEFSNDMVNLTGGAGISIKVVDLTTNRPNTVGVVDKFFRVKYVNNGIAQTTFSINTILSTERYDLTSNTKQILNDNEDVRLVRTVSDLNTDRNTGLLSYEESKRKTGINNAVGISPQAIWSYSENWIPNEISNEKLRVKSGGNLNDTSDGSGARTIEVTFLDENLLEVTETLTLQGSSASATTSANCFRLNEGIVKTVGTYTGANTGDIVLELTGGNIMGNIAADIGNLHQAITTIPSNKTVYITDIYVSVGQSNSADVKLFFANQSDDVTSPFNSKILEWSISDFSGAELFKFDTHLKVNPKTDIWFEGLRITGGLTARVSVGINYYTILNN